VHLTLWEFQLSKHKASGYSEGLGSGKEMFLHVQKAIRNKGLLKAVEPVTDCESIPFNEPSLMNPWEFWNPMSSAEMAINPRK